MINYAKLRSLTKEGAWVAIGQLALISGSLVLVRVLTEYLSPSQYGQLSLGLTVSALVNKVIMGGLNNGVGRFYSVASEQDDPLGYIISVGWLMLYAALATLLLSALILVGLMAMSYNNLLILASLALLLSVFIGLNASLNNLQNAARRRATSAIHKGGEAWLKILLATGTMTWLGTSSESALLGYLLASVLVLGSHLIFLKPIISNAPAQTYSTSYWSRKIWSYSWPFSTWGIFTWAQHVSDRWSLQTFVSTEDVGFYAVIFQLGYVPIGMVTTLVTIFISPIIYQRSGSATDPKRNQEVHNITWAISGIALALACIAFFITFIVHEPIFRLLAADQYQAVSHLLPWMILAGGIGSSTQVISLKLMSDIKSSILVFPKVITSVLGVILNLLGAFLFGIEGVIAAMIMFSVSHFTWIALLSRGATATR